MLRSAHALGYSWFACYGNRCRDILNYSVMLGGLAIVVMAWSALVTMPMGVMRDKIGRKPIIIFGYWCSPWGSLVAAFAEHGMG